MKLFRLPGVSQFRYAERQCQAKSNQLPPRDTRNEPLSGPTESSFGEEA